MVKRTLLSFTLTMFFLLFFLPSANAGKLKFEFDLVQIDSKYWIEPAGEMGFTLTYPNKYKKYRDIIREDIEAFLEDMAKEITKVIQNKDKEIVRKAKAGEADREYLKFLEKDLNKEYHRLLKLVKNYAEKTQLQKTIKEIAKRDKTVKKARFKLAAKVVVAAFRVVVSVVYAAFSGGVAIPAAVLTSISAIKDVCDAVKSYNKKSSKELDLLKARMSALGSASLPDTILLLAGELSTSCDNAMLAIGHTQNQVVKMREQVDKLMEQKSVLAKKGITKKKLKAYDKKIKEMSQKVKQLAKLVVNGQREINKAKAFIQTRKLEAENMKKENETRGSKGGKLVSKIKGVYSKMEPYLNDMINLGYTLEVGLK